MGTAWAGLLQEPRGQYYQQTGACAGNVVNWVITPICEAAVWGAVDGSHWTGGGKIDVGLMWGLCEELGL